MISRSDRLGSSPHTRGAQSPSALAGACGGIIPAYAGSTTWPSSSTTREPDHPRIRGEHMTSSGVIASSPGSSPHTRGALGPAPRALQRERIIPAYAGSTRPGSGRTVGPWDHPRIRGEHRGGHVGGPGGGGSSPHTRGAPPASGPGPAAVRIIPAYAGSTRRRAGSGPWGADHPRIRGEHASLAQCAMSASGSSPHTRGARPGLGGPGRRRGIIPAYAGSTDRAGLPEGAGPDHPRIRGEHCWPSATPSAAPGSSPHTRGAHAVGARDLPDPGIIPAYAGSTYERVVKEAE